MSIYVRNRLGGSLLAIACLLALTGCPCCPVPPPDHDTLTCSQVPDSNELAVTAHRQEMSNWCWAASAQMVMEYLGVKVTQCEEAKHKWPTEDCCATPSACNEGNWPDFGYYGFDCKQTTNAALTWNQVREQIGCKKKPFAFSWRWNGDSGHMMVCDGYLIWDGEPQVIVVDPLGTRSGMHTYKDYVSGNDHTHWNDYYDVTKR